MLEKEIRDFDLKTIGVVTPDDKDGKMSDAFKPIAETILSGYFKVTKNNSDSYVTVHPTCVEIYYHEEGTGDDKVKDFIVYHRNSDSGKIKKDVFPLGILHNHVSGIDLTFERRGNDGNPIRFSALIREFWVDERNKKVDQYEMNVLRGCREDNPDRRPTHLYDALYSQFSVFEGFSIQWLDGKDDEKKKIELVATRINVPQYELDEKSGRMVKAAVSDADRSGKGRGHFKPCSRMWRYSINRD